MLHDQDTKMVLMNPGDPNSLFHMDIERGKIVEEWKVHDDITVDHIAPESKFAPTTQEQTLVGASHNALFRVDPRVSGTKLVDSQYKQYAGKNRFSGVTTTESGKIAVASEKGEIRLFDTIGKNAKTALPPLGDAISGIDVTADGRWIIATTKTYIILVDTLIGKGPHEGKLGFDRSFPADAKPKGRRLQLRNEHIAYMNHDISFSPARYAGIRCDLARALTCNLTGSIREKDKLRTRSSRLPDNISLHGTLPKLKRVSWTNMKLRSMKITSSRTILGLVMIKRLWVSSYYPPILHAGIYKHQIVALDDNVLSVNKKALKKPTRVSLGGSLPSGIVKTWE
jgi:hypothetical protein